jgi:hypothetical protein
MSELQHKIGFAPEAAAEFVFVTRGGGKDFDGDVPILVRIVSLVYDSHAAPANFIQELIAA